MTWLWRGPRRAGAALLGGLAAAWALAIALYYGVYLADLLTRTLPQMLGGQGAAAGGATAGGSTVHWTGPFDPLVWTADYLVSLLPLLLGATGLALFFWQARSSKPPGQADISTPSVAPQLRTQNSELRTLLAWWIAILPIFVLVNYRVDMIGKHLFYTMVPLALGSGIALAALGRRGRWGRVWTGLLAAGLAGTALVFWIERLWRASGG